MGRSRASSERDLGAQLERMSHRTTAIHRMLEDTAAPLDATGWLVVRVIGAQGPIRASDIADGSRLSRPTVSRCVAALARAGLVELLPDPADGRASLVRLTERGRAHADQVLAATHDRVRDMTHDFSVAELDTLTRLLARLNAAAEARSFEPDRYTLETHR